MSGRENVLSLRSLFGAEAGVLRERDFQLLFLVGVILPFGNGPLSPILDSLVGPFDASVGTIGLLISVFVAPSIVVIPAVGVLADRYGRKLLLTPSLALFGAAGSLIALTSAFELVLLLRFLQGIGWAGLTVLVVASIGDLYTGIEETTAQGLRQTGSGIAGAIVSIIAGWLVLSSWHYPFLLYLLVFPAAAAVYLWLGEPSAHRERATDDRADGDYRRELFELVSQPRVFAISAARTLPIVGYFGFVTYNSVIVVRLLGGSPAQSGLLYAVMTGVFALVASQAGRVAALIGDRYATLAVANLILGTGLATTFIAPRLLVFGIGSVLVGLGSGLALPVYRSLITGFASVTHRGGLVSVSATASRILGTLTPIVMGAAIASMTSPFGFSRAVQLTGVATAVVVGGGGLVFIGVAYLATPVEPVSH